MKKIPYRTRNRYNREHLEEVWEQSTRPALDPGLREKYASLPRAPITLVCCAMGKAVNHGGILRLAEAYRLENVVYEMEANRTKEFSGVRGSHKWQPWEWGDPIEALTTLKSNGYRVYGLSLEDRAISIHKTEWKFPCALVVGRELEGVPPKVEELCDEILAIPLYGITVSLNVGMAAAIALDRALEACHSADPSFLPVRESSRELL